MTTRMFGISNCDTVKKARAFLAEHRLEHQFHDYARLGVPPASLDRWIAGLGWEALLNRKGTTWRKLDDAQRAAVIDAGKARALMTRHASVIKRPVMEWANGDLTVGFEAAEWARRI